MLEIESEFDIEISESDMESSEFRTVGGLMSIVKKRMSSSNQISNDQPV